MVIGILELMAARQQQPWEGTASALLSFGAGRERWPDSPDSLGRWLANAANQQRLAAAGIRVTQHKSKTTAHERLIRIEIGHLDTSDG